MSTLTSRPAWHAVAFDLVPAAPAYEPIARKLTGAMRSQLAEAGLTNPTEGVPSFIELLQRGQYSANEAEAAIQIKRDVPNGHSFVIGQIKADANGKPVLLLKFITYPMPVGSLRREEALPPPPAAFVAAGEIGRPIESVGQMVPIFYQAAGQTMQGLLVVAVPVVQEVSIPIEVDATDEAIKGFARAAVSQLQIPDTLRVIDETKTPPPVHTEIVPAQPVPAQAQTAQSGIMAMIGPITPMKITAAALVIAVLVAGGVWAYKKMGEE